MSSGEHAATRRRPRLWVVVTVCAVASCSRPAASSPSNTSGPRRPRTRATPAAGPHRRLDLAHWDECRRRLDHLGAVLDRPRARQPDADLEPAGGRIVGRPLAFACCSTRRADRWCPVQPRRSRCPADRRASSVPKVSTLAQNGDLSIHGCAGLDAATPAVAGRARLPAADVHSGRARHLARRRRATIRSARSRGAGQYQPSSLTTLWTPGTNNVITQGAVMNFENQNGLKTDGLAGPQVWTDLLADIQSGKGNAQPWDYVLVSQSLPETATVYKDGAEVYSTPVNTGVPGATTENGTWPVFARYTVTTMTGTNPDGSHYSDPGIPWVSYFHGGDALHGFVRGSLRVSPERRLRGDAHLQRRSRVPAHASRDPGHRSGVSQRAPRALARGLTGCPFRAGLVSFSNVAPGGFHHRQDPDRGGSPRPSVHRVPNLGHVDPGIAHPGRPAQHAPLGDEQPGNPPCPGRGGRPRQAADRATSDRAPHGRPRRGRARRRHPHPRHRGQPGRGRGHEHP